MPSGSSRSLRSNKKRPALTPCQQKVLDFLTHWFQKQPLGPSIREIASELEIHSLGNVYRYLMALEEKGYLRRNPRCARSIQLLRPNARRQNGCEIPVKAILSNQQILPVVKPIQIHLEGKIRVPQAEFFFLRIQEDAPKDLLAFHAGAALLFQKVFLAAEADTVLVRDLEGKLRLADCVRHPESKKLVLKIRCVENCFLENHCRHIWGVAIAGLRHP